MLFNLSLSRSCRAAIAALTFGVALVAQPVQKASAQAVLSGSGSTAVEPLIDNWFTTPLAVGTKPKIAFTIVLLPAPFGPMTPTICPTIFAETTINPKLIQAVAKEANVKVSDRELFGDGLGEKGSEGDTYPKMLIANMRTIVEGLGGKYTEFQGK